MELIDKATVKHVAHLARLSLNDKELELYSAQLVSILAYISKLNEISTEGVTPTSHPLSSLKNVFRSDTLKPSLEADEALNNAPAQQDGFFKVPQIIEGK